MSSKGGGKHKPIFLSTERADGKYDCSFMDICGTFHTLPKQSELAKISKIMKKYKCKKIMGGLEDYD